MAFEPGALSGASYLTIDGVQYDVVDGVGFKVSKAELETVMGQNGVHGYKLKQNAPYIKAKIRDTVGTRVADFSAMTAVSVSLELISGKRVTGNSMWCVGAIEVDSDEAVFEVKFEGPDVAES